MQDLFSVPSCFSSGNSHPEDPAGSSATADATARPSGQRIAALSYCAEIAGQRRLVTVTWCKNLLAHGLAVSIEGLGGEEDDDGDKRNRACKVELRPWHFWRRHAGSRQLHVGGRAVGLFWDLRGAKFAADEPEPESGYYVAVVDAGEVAVLVGDLKKEAFRRTGARPSMMDAVLVHKKEHVFGKKRFSTRARLHDKGRLHEFIVECNNGGLICGNMDVDMVIKIDGQVSLQVRHLQWKFRGNESISLSNLMRVQVFWDVHDWLFSTGLRHALFVFKPETTPSSSLALSFSTAACSSSSSGGSKDHSTDDHGRQNSSGICLFLYAWKVE